MQNQLRQGDVATALSRTFWRLWLAEGSATLGLAVSGVVAPLLVLDLFVASPFQVSALLAAENLPWLVLGLAAGVWVDRWPKRTILVRALAARALVLGSVPVSWLLGVLSYGQMLAVMLVVGVSSVFFELAMTATVPAVVRREQLVLANTRLSTARTASSLTGEASGGVLFQLVGGPVAFLIEAATSVVAAVSVRQIDTSSRDGSQRRSSFGQELRDGLRYTFGHRSFRAITMTNAVVNFAEAARYALLVPLLVQVVRADTWAVGLLLMLSGLGGLAGAASTGVLTRAIGTGRTWRFALLAGAAFGLLLPLAGPGFWGLARFVAGALGLAFFLAVVMVIGSSARQAICPPSLIGRMSATSRVVTWGVIPVGALVGGAVGTLLSIRAGLWLAISLFFVAWLVLMISPMRSMRDVNDLEPLTMSVKGAADGAPHSATG